jgi:hypothetical protein
VPDGPRRADIPLVAMLVKEAEWIAGELGRIASEDLFPLLNVGSSTMEFRTRTQPHIESLVFGPLERRGGQVWHSDIKASPGIDIVGDLSEPDIVSRVRELEIRSALVSNVLEHVRDRQGLARAVTALVPDGGYIIVTGPHRFPYHPDPIDNGFRPGPEELRPLFPGTTVVAKATIDAGNWRQWDPRERARSRGRTVTRALVPFYRPRGWLDAARNVPYLIRHVSAFGVVLRKG